MRLFVAITPPGTVLDELDAAFAPLAAGCPWLRWTSRAARHLTLAFLGDVAEPAAGRLPARLERAAARHPPVGLRASGAGAFPGAARARVLWAGLDGDKAALGRLAASVAAAAARAGACPPDAGRRFRPHITMARSREPADLRPLLASLADLRGSPWTAGQLHLIRSHLGPDPRYETLGSWPLRGRGPGQSRSTT